MKKTDMNLYESYLAEKKAVASRTSPFRIYLAIIVFSVLILGAIGIKLFVDNTVIKNKITEIEAYINDPKIKDKITEVNEIQKKIIALSDIEEEVELIRKVLNQIPMYDSELLDILYYERPSDIRYTTLTYEENTVYVEFSSYKPSSASNYALSLQHTNLFADVSYEGYGYDTVNGVYRGVIKCMLKGGN